MGRLAAVGALMLVALASGCQHLASKCAEPCPPAATTACPTPTTLPPVEVKAPEEIRVKAPPQKITVTLPPGYGEAPAAAAPGYAPQPAMSGYAPAPGALMTGATQEVSRPHSRITLGFDFFHLPIPYPKLFSLPVEQEVVTRQTFQAVPAPAAAPAPVYAPAPAPAAPVYVPVPVYAPAPAPMPMYAPAPPPAYAPVVPPPAECEPCPKGPVLQHLHDKLDCLKSHLKHSDSP